MLLAQTFVRVLRAIVSLIASVCGGNVARKLQGFYLPDEPHQVTGIMWYGPYYDYPNGWQPGTRGAQLLTNAPPPWTRFVWSSIPPAYLLLVATLGLFYAFHF